MTTAGPDAPFLSVIVPTFLRPANLAGCLEALAAQRYPRDRFEVIVVDDGSGQPPHDVVGALRARLTVLLVEGPHGGPALARNIGASRACGSALVFTDDDCRPHPEWLAAIAARLGADPTAGVGGRVINELAGNWYSEASQAVVSYVYEYYAGTPESFFCTDNLALSASGFRAIGGFDVISVGLTGEDRDLCERWRASGRPLTYAPEAIVLHAHALTLRTFLRQHWRYGRDAVDVYRNRRHRTGRAARPELHFYAGLLASPFRAGFGVSAPCIALLIGASQIAYAAGVVGRIAREWLRLPGAPRVVRDTLRYD